MLLVRFDPSVVTVKQSFIASQIDNNLSSRSLVVNFAWFLTSKDTAVVNSPLPSSKNSHFQNEHKCKTFLVTMSFICMRRVAVISMASHLASL